MEYTGDRGRQAHSAKYGHIVYKLAAANKSTFPLEPDLGRSAIIGWTRTGGALQIVIRVLRLRHSLTFDLFLEMRVEYCLSHIAYSHLPMPLPWAGSGPIPLPMWRWLMVGSI